MTRTISLIIGITATVLSVGVAPALGEGRLAGSQEQATVAPDWFERAATRAQNGAVVVRVPDAHDVTTTSGSGYLDAQERVVESQSLRAERLRSEALNRKYGLGEFALGSAATYPDAQERVVEPQSLRAERIRSEALNRQYGLGEFGTANGYRDGYERAVPVSSDPISVTPTSSGRDIEWPQVGIVFALGIALALGLLLAMRSTRGRELAH